MPNRIIRDQITTSESLAAISADAERLWWRLITKADDFGRYHARTRIIASTCFPLDPPKDARVEAWLGELVAQGMIIIYGGPDGKPYLSIVHWDDYQSRRARSSKYPPPPADACKCKQMQADASRCMQVQADANICKQMQADAPEESRNRGIEESRNRGCEESVLANDEDPAQVDDGFAAFWTGYPKKRAKAEAEKAWKKIKPDADLAAEIMAAVDTFKRSPQWLEAQGKYIPYPATFLNGRRWEDEIQAPGGDPEIYDDDGDFFGA